MLCKVVMKVAVGFVKGGLVRCVWLAGGRQRGEKQERGLERTYPDSEDDLS